MILICLMVMILSIQNLIVEILTLNFFTALNISSLVCLNAVNYYYMHVCNSTTLFLSHLTNVFPLACF